MRRRALKVNKSGSPGPPPTKYTSPLWLGSALLDNNSFKEFLAAASWPDKIRSTIGPCNTPSQKIRRAWLVAYFALTLSLNSPAILAIRP